MKDECKGCKLYDYDDQGCRCQVGIPRYKDSRKCPCTECIVKPICIDICSPLIDYVWLFYGHETDLDFRFRVYLIKGIRGG